MLLVVVFSPIGSNNVIQLFQFTFVALEMFLCNANDSRLFDRTLYTNRLNIGHWTIQLRQCCFGCLFSLLITNAVVLVICFA